jgi:putative Mg2+ transporter-C (MgtC) family protein
MPVDFVWRLLLAAGLGAALGLEREYRQKPAGLRTNILIAMGSALFTIMSAVMVQPGVDPSRIAAQIVTGIGFLGGGAIMRNRDTVHGMTTAATIWVNAAIGVAAGTGQYALATFDRRADAGRARRAAADRDLFRTARRMAQSASPPRQAGLSRTTFTKSSPNEWRRAQPASAFAALKRCATTAPAPTAASRP